MVKPMEELLETPTALIEEVLAKSKNIGDQVSASINNILENKSNIRNWMVSNDMIGTDEVLEDVDMPTTCGVDGAYVLERLLSTSIVACAAVTVEGFTPPSEKKRWPIKHEIFVDIERHNPQLNNVVRGLMKVMETNLSSTAPHDVVLLDGSARSNVIHMNQAISAARKNSGKSFRVVGDALLQRYSRFLKQFKTILDSNDRIYANLPKYTTKSEISDLYKKDNGWCRLHDDRFMMTMILASGEYTKPFRVGDDNVCLSISSIDDPDSSHLAGACLSSINNQMVFYYKPVNLAPALRVEVGSWVEYDKYRFARLLRALKSQFMSHMIMEPYPLYVADNMVKNLGKVMPTLTQSILQKLAKNQSVDIEKILFSVRGYRTGY